MRILVLFLIWGLFKSKFRRVVVAQGDVHFVSLVPRLEAGDLRAIAHFFELQLLNAKRLNLSAGLQKSLRRARDAAYRGWRRQLRRREGGMEG